MTPASPTQDYSENALELAALDLFENLGWETGKLFGEWAGGRSNQGRKSQREVLLPARLWRALKRLNPDRSDDALAQAMEILSWDRSTMIPVNANQEIYEVLKDGIKVTEQSEQGELTTERVQLIDWRTPANNDFFVGSQFWVRGQLDTRRCDLIGFVNGIPLLFLELKSSERPLKSAYDENLSDYRSSIPQLFAFNGFFILSNGSKSVMGSTYAPWEFVADWKRINDEGETGKVSLETMMRGTATPERLLDIVENFTVFEKVTGGLVKKVAKNHQYLGVNKAIEALKVSQHRPDGEAGRLGVFWHTQGSGKSLSMVFFTQKVLRTLPGDWTFVIVTDRQDLDRQIYKTYTATGAVTEETAQASSGAKLKEMLCDNHRYVFTLIHKFKTNKGETYPKLSDRRNIIVITDEAHRSQYDVLALNMRSALPQAAFLGFTGTPLIKGEEGKTKEVFGDYISVYNFAQSVVDGATVPLFYENRIPELRLTTEELPDELTQLLDDAELDEDQELKVERLFAREHQLITRPERLDTIAKDLVTHFTERGYQGKAMMVSIDKATAIRMYDNVQRHWQDRLRQLKQSLATASDDARDALEADIQRMEKTDMAVIVSEAQNEKNLMAAKGLDITQHRQRMKNEDLDEKFKDPQNPLRLVFVCAMWITGFDVPSCSTIYLDKPMRNHTLMQTIARANRTDPGKTAGLIIDYIGVLYKLKDALSIYGTAEKDNGSLPIKDKTRLVEHLHELIAEANAYLLDRGIEPTAIKQAHGFDKIALLDSAVEALLETDDSKKTYLGLAAAVSRVYQAILPDPRLTELLADEMLIRILAQKIKALREPANISNVAGKIEEFLDKSITSIPYEIEATHPENLLDLSRIDFEKLKENFTTGRKRTETEKLRALLDRKLIEMTKRNPSRAEFMTRFRQLVENYNAASRNIEAFYDELLKFTKELNEEAQRALREGLSEEELVVFDILTKDPKPDLTVKERSQIKKVCKALLEKLKSEKLILDWQKKPQTRSAVEQTIEIIFDEGLPEIYDEALYKMKCSATFEHIYASYAGVGQSTYTARL